MADGENDEHKISDGAGYGHVRGNGRCATVRFRVTRRALSLGQRIPAFSHPLSFSQAFFGSIESIRIITADGENDEHKISDGAGLWSRCAAMAAVQQFDSG